MRRSISLLSLALVGWPGLAQADAATDWNRTALGLIAARSVPPPVASRALAIVSVAMSDAANAVDRRYAGFAYGGAVPAPGADGAAAVSRAACDALKGLFPSDAGALEGALQARLMLSGPGRAGGEAVGAGAARAILDARANDGWDAASSPYLGSQAAGHWRPTGPGYAAGLLPSWGRVTPFTMTAGGQYRPGAMPAIGSAEYARDLAEVRALGGRDSTARTAEQAAIATFWAAGAGTVTPPGMWNEIAAGAIERRGESLAKGAHDLAMLNTVLADAGIAAWDAKYAWELWRPETAIRAEGDLGWTPMLTTPNFPSYVSGHSTFSGAGAAVLTALYGDEPGGFDVLSGGSTRHFLTFADAAAEAGRSRIYGGIHFEFDDMAGQALGRDVARGAIASPFAAPVPEPATLLAMGVGALGLLRRRRPD